jgi:hypothetical protein
MTWVSENLNCHLFAVWHISSPCCSKMVFDISRVLLPICLSIWCWSDSLHFSEDGLEWLVNNISKHIESTSMRHSNDDLFCSTSLQSIHAGFHSWNE